MSQLIPKAQLETGDVFGMLLDSGSMFNLQVLQAGLGHTNEASTKAWCAKYGVKPLAQGRTWLFDTDSIREQLKSRAKEDKQC